MAEPLITAIGAIVAKEVFKYFIKETFLKKTIAYLFPSDYKSRLESVVNTTVLEFATRYPIKTSERGMIPFFFSAEVISSMLKFTYYNGEAQVDLSGVKQKRNISPHTSEQVKEFLEFFNTKLLQDEKLKNSYLSENYQEKIFVIDQKLQRLSDGLEAVTDSLRMNLLNDEYRAQLDQINKHIRNFKPVTALEELLTLEGRIQVKDNAVKARLLFLKGICHLETHDTAAANRNFIQARNLDKLSNDIAEQAAMSYWREKEFEKAIEIAKTILSTDELNPTANAIDGVLSYPNFDSFFSSISSSVKQTGQFRLISAILGSHKYGMEYYPKPLEPDINSDLPTAITYTNKAIWINVSRAMLLLINQQIPDVLLARTNPKIAQHPYFKKVFQLLEMLERTFLNSEKYSYEVYTRFFLHYSRFLNSADVNQVDLMFAQFNLLKQEEQAGVSLRMAITLCQVGRYQEVLQLPSKFRSNETYKNLVYIGVYSAIKLNKHEEAIALGKEYFSSNAGDSNILHFIQFLELLQVDVAEKETIIHTYTNQGFFQEEKYQKLAWAVILPAHENRKAETHAHLIELKGLFASEKVLLEFIANKFFNLGYTDEAIEILSKTVDRNEESSALYLYILCLLESKKHSQLLLELLAHWRKNHTPSFQFFIEEIRLRQAIPDWPEIENIARAGLVSFPANEGMIYYLLISLVSQKKLDEIPQIIQNVFSDPYTDHYAFQIAAIANHCGFTEKAIELIYDKAKEPGKKSMREKYFVNYMMWINKRPDLRKSFERATTDSFAVVSYSNGETEILNMNDSSSITKQLLNKKIGDNIVRQSMTGSPTIVSIQNIVDKYQALYLEINEEIKKGNSETAVIFDFDAEIKDGKSISDIFSKTFGKANEERINHKEAILERYYSTGKSYSEVSRLVFDDDPISAYQFLASDRSKGLRIVPRSNFQNLTIPSDTIFVLDFSSLLLLFHMEEVVELESSNKFVISQYIPNKIEALIEELKIMGGPKMSLRITSENVTPFLYADNYKEQAISFYENILSWINKYCVVELAPEKLDVLRQLDNKDILEEYMYFMIDTAFLASKGKHCLISDDLMLFNLMKENPSVISTEHYLWGRYNPKFENIILPFLIKKNYLGITLTSKNLLDSYLDSISTKEDWFAKCLRNLSPIISADTTSLNKAIECIKSIYLLNLTQNQKFQATFLIFQACITDVPIAVINQITPAILGLIEVKFSLLQTQKKEVKKCYMEVYRIAVNKQ